MCDGFSMRLAQKFVMVNEIVPRNGERGGPVACRGTNIIDGEKHNCQDKIKLHTVREASCPGTPRIFANGSVVWGVAVCVGVGMRFCTVPVDEQDLGFTIKLSR